MNQKAINNIRDAATLIRSTNPKLSFDLFSLALKYRPSGVYIKKCFNELKNELGIKTFFVIGNCQARVISTLIESKSECFIAETQIEAHKYIHDDSIYDILDNVDYIITQNISDNFEGINTKNIAARYKDKVVTILNLYFEGYHPDWCYVPTINGVRLQSLIGDYHNRTFLESFVNGVSEEEAIENYYSEEFNLERYSHIPDKSLLNLKEREKDVDIKMTDVIEDGFKKGKVLFHTFNHPNKELLNIEVDRVLDHLGLSYEKKPIDGECLNGFIMRTNSVFSGGEGSTDSFKNGFQVNIEDFAKHSYDLYQKNPDFIHAFKLRENLI